MSKRPLIIFHQGCHDGFTAAWCVARKLGGAPELRGARYGDPVPELKGRRVFIVDFSWPPGELIPAAEGALSVTVLDHHQSAWQDWAAQVPGAHAPVMAARLGPIDLLIDLERSGARLAWRWAGEPPGAEALVAYVEDRDLWRWELADSEAVSTRLTLQAQTLGAWDEAAGRLSDLDLAKSGWVREGDLLLKQTRRRVKRQARMAVRVPALAGIYEAPVLLANAPVLTSETCHKLLQTGAAQVAIAWWIARDAVSMSLRSTLKADVSALSRRLGEVHPGFVSGGGHPQAAGARFGRVEGLALVSGWLGTATDWKF